LMLPARVFIRVFQHAYPLARSSVWPLDPITDSRVE
jgi:hypothetical protein